VESFFIGVSLAIGLLILLCLYRGIFGPTVYDRIIGVGFVGTKTIILIVLMGFIYGRIDMFVDCALAYSILNFTGTLIFAKYFVKKRAE